MNRTCAVLVVIVGGILATTAQATEERTHRYEISLPSDFSRLDVEACFDGPVPRVLHASSSRAPEYLLSIEVVGDAGAASVRQRRTRLYTTSVPDSACLKYAVDINVTHIEDRQHRFTDSYRRIGDDLTAPPSLWLWRPEELTPDTDIEIVFRLPEGVAVSTPWQLVWRGHETVTYRVGRASMHWSALVAFGRFDVQDMTVPGGRIRLAVLDADPPADVDKVRKWLRHAAGAVATVSGKFPIPDAQMLVIPVAVGSDPILSPFSGEENADPFPFAMITRGGRSAGIFFIDQRRPQDEFVNDWVAVHELSHMLHPFLGNSGAWLSEGMASYYQQVLRGRTGVLSEQQAWDALHKGFMRGLNGRSGLTLTEASRQRRKRNTYMQIYWSGAAIAFMADVELRRRTDGTESLDTALGRFQECCLPAEKRWSAGEFMEKLDELVDADVFAGLYHQYTKSTDFPDFASAYESLGIVAAPESIELIDAPDTRHRVGIMSARSPGTVD